MLAQPDQLQFSKKQTFEESYTTQQSFKGTGQVDRKVVHVTRTIRPKNESITQQEVLQNDKKLSKQYGNLKLVQVSDGRKVLRDESDLLSSKPRVLEQVQITKKTTETLPSKTFTRN